MNPTWRQVEQYIAAADMELGPERYADWTEPCRRVLRAMLGANGPEDQAFLDNIELHAAEERIRWLIEIRSDIDAICSIYRTVGNAMYDEPRQRLAERITDRIMGDV